MEYSEAKSVYLRRIDPSQNMCRFYSLAIQPTLFGEVSVIRNWGRIDCAGQIMQETFDSLDDAVEKFGHLRQIKVRKGYCPADKDEGFT